MWHNRNTLRICIGLPFLLALIGLVVAISLCCTPNYNLPKDKDFKALKYEIDEFNQDSQSLIFASFSGGGTRAACMSWEVLKQLKKIDYRYKDKNNQIVNSNLSEQIDYISSISGGSFAAAAWCMFKDSMEVFDARFIERNIQVSILANLIRPDRLLQSISPYYNRINVASELYDKSVYNHTHFNQLPKYPVLWINSTALALGLRFTYNQDYFDLLGSDIGSYPVAYACAASSAFPILLDPITLKNYGETLPDSVLLKDVKYRMALKNSSDWEKYYYCKTIQFFNNKNNKWIHMADGGLTDNQGLQAILDQFQTNGIINKAVNDASEENPLKRLVFINVNAGTETDDNSCEKHTPPRVLSVVKYTMTISMDRLSAKRWEEIKLRSKDKLELMKANGLEFEAPYFIEINFRNLKNDSIRSECMNLTTSFYLKKNQLELIRSSVKTLVEENDELNRLKRSLFN